MTPFRAVVLALPLLLAAVPAPPEPPDYRMDDYRPPTPATLQGAAVLSTEQAEELWQSHRAVFIDVLPSPPRPVGLPPETIWRPKPRADIPDSLWLPDTGYGALAPRMLHYFEQNLHTATASDPTRKLVFYCLRDCWMSWNAAKRALALGYTNVAWYPDGTDGWAEHALPLTRNEPQPRPTMTE
jgi:PQQ-dependent catabolism-associated CXXCW motif protein